MKLEFSIASKAALGDINSQAIIILVPDDAQTKTISVDINTYLTTALNDGDFKTNAGDCLLLRHLPVLKTPRLFFLGLGKSTSKDVQKAMVRLIAELKKYEQIQTATISLDALPDVSEELVENIVKEGIAAAYVYDFTKKPKEQTVRVVAIELLSEHTASVTAGLRTGQAIANGIQLAKELGNRPGNYVTPSFLAETAQKLSKECALIKSQIFDLDDIKELNMGAFLAVSQGSEQQPKFIVLEYNGADQTVAPIVLVGKGITFDSGGISIKPGAGMDEMKFDMCGAASVLGTFAALGQLQPKVNVVGLIPSCENLPSGVAVKPGDVVTSMSGQTIEVLNTDAEGRLILCDALTYAEQYKPQAVIDIATLTGACVVALGKVNSGLFSNDEELQNELQQAGVRATDLCWPMPMNDEYDDLLKSNFADIANIGGRDGGAITAAKFLQRFTKAYKWAHLDIAGTAWLSGAKKGATGRPVALLTHYLLKKAVK